MGLCGGGFSLLPWDGTTPARGRFPGGDHGGVSPCFLQGLHSQNTHETVTQHTPTPRVVTNAWPCSLLHHRSAPRSTKIGAGRADSGLSPRQVLQGVSWLFGAWLSSLRILCAPRGLLRSVWVCSTACGTVAMPWFHHRRCGLHLMGEAWGGWACPSVGFCCSRGSGRSQGSDMGMSVRLWAWGAWNADGGAVFLPAGHRPCDGTPAPRSGC